MNTDPCRAKPKLLAVDLSFWVSLGRLLGNPGAVWFSGDVQAADWNMLPREPRQLSEARYLNFRCLMLSEMYLTLRKVWGNVSVLFYIWKIERYIVNV